MLNKGPNKNWFKGNLHTHTTNSDGDTAPEHVSDWYHGHGYDFLVLSDHNHRTILDGSDAERAEWPHLIPGEEVTSAFNGAPIHLGGVGVTDLVVARDGESLVETIQANIDAINESNGLVTLNHPNYKWAYGDREIIATHGAWAMEVFNGHPGVNNEGGGASPSAESIWDRVLVSGQRMFGVATDDAHHFQGEFGPRRSNPGRGWISVNAEGLSDESLLEAMSRGDFYASTGVKFAELEVRGREIVMEVEPDTDLQLKYTVVFTGPNGRELWTTSGESARFTLSRIDDYVRATVYASNGEKAWTQPVFGD
ncbi:MAG: PHP domain-containing protein [Chloroflexi bacterium]|nr:PHP domain-containing protein [Chloroflexota bacterium]MBT4073689.1 PHP domain-containing protein [Chloroflexota bacterium]MBT4516170.1 PHP domain-containing protein [Chloroflexota bacterium]